MTACRPLFMTKAQKSRYAIFSVSAHQPAEQGRKLPFGAINNKRSMVYVENVVDAAITAIESENSRGEVYLVCDKCPYSTKEVYVAICQAMGKPPLLRTVPLWLLKLMGYCGDIAKFILRRDMPVDSSVISRITGDLCFSSEKIRNELGFSPAVNLTRGIEKTALWYTKRQ